MPILSRLRTTASAGARFAQELVKTSRQTNVPARGMGGHRMVVKPSEYQKNRVKDDLIYFLGLGLIPIGLITTYANVRIGPAELQDTPEGYVPEHYEYYRLPITRFMAKYLTNNSVEKFHERTLYYLYVANEKRKLKALKKKVKQEQYDKQTQKGWYYVPVMPSTVQEKMEAVNRVQPVLGQRD